MMGYPLTEALVGFCSSNIQLTIIGWLGIGALHTWIWYLFIKPYHGQHQRFLAGIVIAGPIAAAWAIAVFAIYFLIVLPLDWVYDWLWYQFKGLWAAENRRKNVV